MYAKSLEDFWNDICNRFGVMNEHLIYQIQHKIANVKQGTSTVIDFFNKLKKLYDELQNAPWFQIVFVVHLRNVVVIEEGGNT